MLETNLIIVGILLAVVVPLALAIVCALKGKYCLALLGFFCLPILCLVGAIRLAKPGSRWAQRYSGDKLDAARRRFPARPDQMRAA